MKICLVAPALPPKMDAIGHYTACMASCLARDHEVLVLMGWNGEPDPIPGVRAECAFAPAERHSILQVARRVAAERPDAVVLQYNPFSYGKWGLNLYLPQAMREIKRRCPNTLFALMIHETFVPATDWKFRVMATWQRLQLRQLGSQADILFTAIDTWARNLSAWFPQKQIVHLPVGSNIPLVSAEREAARAALGIAPDVIVLGLFGTAHVARLLALTCEAADAIREGGQQVAVLYIGPHSAEVRAATGDLKVITEGVLPAEEVSRRFPAIDLFLATFIDGVSTRRGSMMAALQHGLPVVGTSGGLTDQMLKDRNGETFLLSKVGDIAGFRSNVQRLAQDPALRSRIGCAARKLYHDEFAWERIASRMLQNLSAEENHPQPPPS